MLQSVGVNYNQTANINSKPQNSSALQTIQRTMPNARSVAGTNVYALNSPATSLTQSEKQKYLYLINFLMNLPQSKNSEGL
ncbi:hypothetical protein IJ531_01045, partial [bacterium]|nr:hypothetical protein [bacterium]